MSERCKDLEIRVARLERSIKRRDRLVDLDNAALESRIKPEDIHMTLGDVIERARKRVESQRLQEENFRR